MNFFSAPAVSPATQRPRAKQMLRKLGAGALLIAAASVFVIAQAPSGSGASPVVNAPESGTSGAGTTRAATVEGRAPEARAARAFVIARREGPPELRAFLHGMPKGADLHVHLSGAIYAETFLREAAEDGLCINIATLSLVQPAAPQGAPQDPGHAACGPRQLPAATVTRNQPLYDALIDAFSMRTFVPTTGNSGHDHFFATFDKFGGLGKNHFGEWVDEVATRAAAQNEQYLELMTTPDYKDAAALAASIGYHADFAAYRRLLLDQGLRNAIPAIRAEMDKGEARRRELEHCGLPDAEPACAVQVRYLFQVLRGLPRESVFAQTVLAFELASAEVGSPGPRFVGLNFVMPEDGYTSMADYRLHMQMLDALHGFYPKVAISLHAGELAPGLVAPEGLTFHIRAAVEQGHAQRIGHGVDILYEDRPIDLLKEMAAKRVMVEINLTSNDVILGVKGNDHPLPEYRRYGVPVALSTDDEGVSRIDLTNEYVRAAVTYNLSYAELKDMARTSIEHSFLPGASLWSQAEGKPERYNAPNPACRLQLGKAEAAGECAAFLKTSEKAQQEWELERRFRVFEGSF